MFKHIAIPTDGSRLCDRGVKAGVKLARSLGAKVTGVFVIPPYRRPIDGEAALYYMPGMSAEQYKKQCLKAAKKALAAVQIEAQRAGVACDTRIVTAPRTHVGILRAARATKCDAIAMASNGRGAASGLLLGGETTRVLAHATLPVLVTR
jgi:nucleotide-binding universal stress UspA family protein